MDRRGKSEANRRVQWKKGQSGNPAGRPKGSRNRPMSDRAESFIETLFPKKLKALIEEKLGEKLPKRFTWGDAVTMRLGLSGAIEGDTTAARELRESIEGKARQRIEFGGFVTDDAGGSEEGEAIQASDQPIVLRIVYDKDKSHVAEEDHGKD
jgi:hypothetical protein